MAISSDFQTALNEKNVLLTRIMLKDSLLIDPTFVEFDEMILAAEKKLVNLYDEHDGEILIEDSIIWAKEYMDSQMVKLVRNFSKERINLLKNICRHLYRDKVQDIKVERSRQASKSPQISKKQVGAGLAIGGTVVAIAGVAVSKPVITVAGVAVAVVGGYMIISDSQEA